MALFWIIFFVIYLFSRLIIRLLRHWKEVRFHYDSPSISSEKICRAFVISSHQYGSFRPASQPSPLLYRSDSFFSRGDYLITSEQRTTMTDGETNSTGERTASTTPTTNTSLLEQYLQSYNPLQIDLINRRRTSGESLSISTLEEAASETDTRPIAHCYPFSCTSQRKLHQGERYTRLKELDPGSARASVSGDRRSDCSSRLTSVTTIPIMMVTDCSDSQRLHTEIIELNDDDAEKDNR